MRKERKKIRTQERLVGRGKEEKRRKENQEVREEIERLRQILFILALAITFSPLRGLEK